MRADTSDQKSAVSTEWLPRALTKREKEVIQLIAEGLKSREIAEKLNLSAKTVDTHRAHIMDKLGLTNIAQLICYAIQKGFVTVD
ncbi:MAG: response regulator transcription factor [Nitrospirae bacterium]|nr:response regulator transcription factor [Nitrospirota bacterium]MBI3803135.1 response regulator transcription factor [Candidatus Manganitrophaceae bacterium]